MPRLQRLAVTSAAPFLALAGAILCIAAAPPAQAQRQAVLKQIDVPHPYYFREMYLPELTSGPSAVAFSPDGRTLVYSMQGSLWSQDIDSTEAKELTAGPGYDYQPDWSPDGSRIVFVRYRNDALELAELDVASSVVRELTKNKAVNVEPRWSPDGQKLAWVSTLGTGHFHVFVGALNATGLTGSAVWPERRSTVARYYYSPFDHELSPTWSPDGNELIYVGNPETIYGTGGLWRRALASNAAPRAVRIEETTWKARPAWSPDGKRVLYSSYAGRQWHQLWITTAAGGDPLPLSFGDFDATGARWSPDGARIAFISNRAGTTEIYLQDTIGGAQRRLEINSRHYLNPTGELRLRTLDGEGRTKAARIAILAADGRAYAPDTAWIHADDGYDRKLSAFETHYFHSDGDAVITLPVGSASITVWRGLEYKVEHRTVQITADARANLDIKLQPLALPAHWSDAWQSADVHVHMNYGGTYRNTPAHLVRQAEAEDLDVVFDLVVNKEQRIPDIGYFSAAANPASTSSVLLSHGQEYHTSFWGHLGLLGLNDHYLIPGYSAYSGTAAASLYPTNAAVADLAHAQGALVGYVHPFDDLPDPFAPGALTNELPVDVALGKVDYYEVLGFSEHRTSAAIWYRLLNCGFRPAAAAGTDAMANFASLRGPVGMNRVYVLAHPEVTAPAPADTAARTQAWLAGLKAGRTLATNGPLLGFTVEGEPPGAELAVPADERQLKYSGFLRSIVPVDHLEIVMNGKVVRTIHLTGTRASADFAGQVPVHGNGWLLVRAWNDAASPEIFDLYPYATTNAVFFRARGSDTHCGSDAQFFLKWIDRLENVAAANEDYNTAQERAATLAQIHAARAVMLGRQ
jgi:dipeptidyl aminopeptidase/acylaminoacyl peptidase